MSKETWLKEFMPRTADEVATQHPTDAPRLIAHSLRKWIGRRPANLARHDIYVSHGDTADLPTTFHAEDCSLCIAYYIPQGERTPNEEHGCHHCPLFEVLGRPCDEEREEEDEFGNSRAVKGTNVYEEACHGKPAQMIDALALALAAAVEEEA